jgi:8-oxo-dGTP pyrophosphatase MutT (NUDIX family)
MKENRKFKGVFLDKNDQPIEGSDFVDWKSRSMAVAVIVCCKKDNSLVFLAEKRGPGCPDNIGKYCFPCGYLNYDETLKEAAIRETYEETGIKLDPEKLQFININDNPKENRQNVTVRFMHVSEDYYKFKLQIESANINSESRGGEGGECSEIKLIPLDFIRSNPDLFAFNHEKLAELVYDIVY